MEGLERQASGSRINTFREAWTAMVALRLSGRWKRNCWGPAVHTIWAGIKSRLEPALIWSAVRVDTCASVLGSSGRGKVPELIKMPHREFVGSLLGFQPQSNVRRLEWALQWFINKPVSPLKKVTFKKHSHPLYFWSFCRVRNTSWMAFIAFLLHDRPTQCSDSCKLE